MADSQASLNYSTDYNLEYVNLLSAASTQVVNLKPNLVELNIFEDIFSSTISGQLVVSDALGLVSNYRLNGTEFIEIGFNKVKDDKIKFRRVFRVYKLSDRIIDPSNNKESYTLLFCSEEFLLSEQYRISKSCRSQKISDIVTSILSDYLKVGAKYPKTKKCYIEETTGVYDFILPNKRIFETINWLSNYALPATKNPGADMLFYENVNGYQFWSLQTLYGQKSFDTYNYNPKNITKDPNQKFKNAFNFEILNYFDVLGGISRGTFSNRLLSIDPLTREYKVTSFSYNQYFGDGKSLNGNPIANISYRNRHNLRMFDSPPPQSPLQAGVLRMSPTNSEQKKKVEDPDGVASDIFIEKYLPNRVAQIAMSNYTRVRLNIPGNSELSVGMVIEFNAYDLTPDYYSSAREREFDKFYSGRYLITAVRHMIKPTGYITVVELSKESNQTYLPAIQDYNRWKNAIYGIQE